MKIMFMGTPDFAVTALNSIYNAGHEIAAVVTMPDRPKGRGHKMMHTPVYEAGVAIGAQIFTPESLKPEFFDDILKSINPDIIIVVAYGKILPEYVLNYPKYGCINVHASLLPKYRGAAPIQRCIIDGESVTGVTTMYMEKGLDTGDMLMKDEVEITDDETYESLHDKLAISGAKLIVQTITALENGTCAPEKQDDSKSSYAHMITKETACINWNQPAKSVHNLIRGLNPVPKAYTIYNNKIMKIGSSKVTNKVSDAKPGTITDIGKDSFYVACENGCELEILSVQIEGKRMMSVSDFLVGNEIIINTLLGE